MPQYEAIEEYLGVVTKLCGDGDELLRYLISMAIIHCVEQHSRARSPAHRMAAAG
ncbi:hypothetical protein [Rhizobium sp.]